MRTRAYTLTELLVAMTIVAVLAALLTPVFVSAKEEARRASCASNFRQVFLASSLYQVDYDDRFVVSKYTGSAQESSTTDRTWVQLVFPYIRSFAATRCPADTSERPAMDPVFDADTMVGSDVTRYYTLSTRANTGFNFIYLSPLVQEPSGAWYARPRALDELHDPANTLVFGDSVWEVTADGRPTGGGSYLIIPPCRYISPSKADSFELSGYEDRRIYTARKVWDDGRPPRRVRFGGLWPWHSGRLTALMGDGSAHVRTLDQIEAGCDVRQAWNGFITDESTYIWDLH